MNKFQLTMLAATIAGSASIVRAGDVYMTWDGSRIGIGEISEDETTITPGVRVFDGLLGDPFPDTANDPGMMAVAGTFTPGTSTGFEFLKAVRKWDGLAFGASPSGDSFHVYLNPLTSNTPLADVITPGLTIPVDTAPGSAGQWHHHPFWQIDAGAGFGIYLVEVDAFNTATNLRSVPFWFVWDYESDPGNPVNDVDGTRAWVSANLVPTPGAGTAAVMLVCAVSARRRR